MRNNSDMKYVPRVARVFDVSMPLFSTLPSEKAAKDEEEGRKSNKSTRSVTRGTFTEEKEREKEIQTG